MHGGGDAPGTAQGNSQQLFRRYHTQVSNPVVVMATVSIEQT